MLARAGLLLALLAAPALSRAQAASPAAAPLADDGKGFRWLRFELHGRVLAHAWSESVDGASTSDLEAENARLELRWQPSRMLRAVVEADAAEDNHLKDAYVALRPARFELRAGQFKPPVSPIEMASRWALPVADRGLLSELLAYSFGIAGRRPGAQVSWDPKGRGLSLSGGVFRASSARGDRIGDEAFDNLADWGMLKATARLARAGKRSELGVVFDLRPAEPLPGEGYRHFWTAGADLSWAVDRRRGPRAWLEGYAGSSWQDDDAFDGDDAIFLAGRALGAWRFGSEKRKRGLFVEPYVAAALVEPDTSVVDDLLWEASGGVHAGAFSHLRLVLEVQHRQVARNAPLSLGLLPLGQAAPYTRTRLVAQLGAAF